MIQWLVHTDAGLLARILAGVAIFAALAITDLRRHGRSARRWREYGVLLAAVAAALLYGVINDQITCTISPEYFFYGKEIYKTIGTAWPPDMSALRWQAVLVGVKATWSAGLIFGVILLLANNPFRDWPRLRNRDLLRFLPLILGVAALLGILGGILGCFGFLTHLSADFEDLTRANIFRPRRFLCTWGIHLGGYIGGLVGTIIATGLVIHRRRLVAHPTPRETPESV
jgi:hypothetical protein